MRGETVRSPPRAPPVVVPTWPNSAVRPSMFHPSDNESEFKCQSALLGKRFLSVATVIACRQLVCRHHEEFVARYPPRHRLSGVLSLNLFLMIPRVHTTVLLRSMKTEGDEAKLDLVRHTSRRIRHRAILD